MVVRILRWAGGLVVMMFANGLLAHGASGGASAVVEVVTEPLGAAGAFVFTGVPDGTIACGAFNMPLTASREQGVLEVLDGGQAVVGTGFAEDTAQLRMQADGELTGRYAGAVGGEQDGIPMTIEFFWQLITDEWIVGYLTSQVSQPGMTCNMHRTFELRYVGP